MEAKTVMSEEQIGEEAVKVRGLYYTGGVTYLERLIAFGRKIAKAQHKISFPVAYNEGFRVGHDEGYTEARNDCEAEQKALEAE